MSRLSSVEGGKGGWERVCVHRRRALKVLDVFLSRQVKTAAQYACDVWHYVAVTIDGRDGTLYVDGIGAGHTLPSSRDLYTFSVETFNTTTRPDFGADSTGVLKLGCVVIAGCSERDPKPGRRLDRSRHACKNGEMVHVPSRAVLSRSSEDDRR